MRVEVDASQIAALEAQVHQLSMWLTIAVSKRKGRKLVITEADFEKNQGGNVKWEHEDGKTTFIYEGRND